MILKVAIVDDNTVLLTSIKRTIYDFCRTRRIIPFIDEYSKNRLLMYELGEGTYYDLFILDIEVNEEDIDGITLSENIREINPNSLIIFVASHMKYVFAAFKVNAFRYIPKGKMEVQLPIAIIEAITELQELEKKFYVIETITKYIKLYYSHIYYISKSGKYSIINSTYGEYKVRKSLGMVFEELNSKEFIFIERGFIANITHINRMENGHIFFDNNMVIKVSRNQIHFVKDKLAEYWNMHA